MDEKLGKLRAALEELKGSGVLAKGYMAEMALIAAIDLMEEMVREIKQIKQHDDAIGNQAD